MRPVTSQYFLRGRRLGGASTEASVKSGAGVRRGGTWEKGDLGQAWLTSRNVAFRLGGVLGFRFRFRFRFWGWSLFGGVGLGLVVEYGCGGSRGGAGGVVGGIDLEPELALALLSAGKRLCGGAGESGGLVGGRGGFAPTEAEAGGAEARLALGDEDLLERLVASRQVGRDPGHARGKLGRLVRARERDDRQLLGERGRRGRRRGRGGDTHRRRARFRTRPKVTQQSRAEQSRAEHWSAVRSVMCNKPKRPGILHCVVSCRAW